MIAAIDFDGTLCEFKYPDIGKPKLPFIRHCTELRQSGVKLILWTCRSGKQLKDAVAWCKNHGLEFDAVNENILKITNELGFKDDSRKIYADIYIDDKSIRPDEIVS